MNYLEIDYHCAFQVSYQELLEHLLSQKQNVIVLGIYRQADPTGFGNQFPFVLTNPPNETQLMVNDSIIVMGDIENIDNLSQMFNLKSIESKRNSISPTLQL